MSELNGRMAQVAEYLLGDRNQSRSSEQEWRYGNKGSLAVDLASGTFYDHERGEGGGVLDLVQSHGQARNRAEAARWVKERFGSGEPVTWTPWPKPARKPQQSKTADYARELWESAVVDDASVGSHPYALKKGVNWAAGAGRCRASGRVIGKDADCLVVPIRSVESETLQAVQAINQAGEKQTFGPIKGGCLLLGNTLDKTLPFYVCEGWASAVSMVFHRFKGHGVAVVAFGSTNLDRVAETVARIHRPEQVIVLAEVDG